MSLALSKVPSPGQVLMGRLWRECLTGRDPKRATFLLLTRAALKAVGSPAEGEAVESEGEQPPSQARLPGSSGAGSPDQPLCDGMVGDSRLGGPLRPASAPAPGARGGRLEGQEGGRRWVGRCAQRGAGSSTARWSCPPTAASLPGPRPALLPAPHPPVPPIPPIPPSPPYSPPAPRPRTCSVAHLRGAGLRGGRGGPCSVRSGARSPARRSRRGEVRRGQGTAPPPEVPGCARSWARRSAPGPSVRGRRAGGHARGHRLGSGLPVSPWPTGEARSLGEQGPSAPALLPLLCPLRPVAGQTHLGSLCGETRLRPPCPPPSPSIPAAPCHSERVRPRLSPRVRLKTPRGRGPPSGSKGSRGAPR